MSKDIEKSKGGYLLKVLAIAVLSGFIWKIVLRVIAGNDNSWEN